jgi:ADP-dependent NAD(P)H-hydrate dehydratase / NAD(P)H-hydrate epimerase
VSSLVRVVTSSESAARDTSAIAAGVPSRALMQRAGALAASEISLRFGARLRGGALVVAGPGNNGGDAWVVARALDAAGVAVRVVEPVPAKSPDAIAERELARAALARGAIVDWEGAASLDRAEDVVVDGLLGTGASGAPRGDIAVAIAAVNTLRNRGAAIVAIDVPSGVDATTGDAPGDAVSADLTLSFGTVKRGQLVDRARCGDIAVLDIGLGAHAWLDDGAPELVDERWTAAWLPAIAATANKGTRKKLAIVGGAEGMAGASILAARAALRSGVGMVKLVVSPASMGAVQEAEPLALAAAWPADSIGAESDIGDWADAIVLGPGMGRSPESLVVVERILDATMLPVVVDADALNVFASNAARLAALLRGRSAIITPHPLEFARLTARELRDVLAERFDVAAALAGTLGAVVLLKGVPTVVTHPDGRRLVSASGTPVLATAGSGDILSGIAGTLLAQIGDPLAAGAAAAWIHGRAAELAGASAASGGRAGAVRGVTLDDVLHALRDAWHLERGPLRSPVLAELPAVGEV